MVEIIDVRFGDADMETWRPEEIDKLLTWWENIKQEKHGQYCFDQRIFFSVCTLSLWGDGQGYPSRTRHFESNHGCENG